MSNEGCRIRVRPRSVRVNVACPHATMAGFGMYYSNYPSARAEPIAERPIWREGNPERDTGGSAVLLGGGPDSTFVTGLKPYCGRNDYGEPWPHSHAIVIRATDARLFPKVTHYRRSSERPDLSSLLSNNCASPTENIQEIGSGRSQRS